jgi:hypothetical protein
MQKENKVLCTVAIGDHKKLLDYFISSTSIYASEYGFDLSIIGSTTKHNDEPHFEKIEAILRLMNDYDYVFYLDCDLKIMNYVNDNSWLYIVKEKKGNFNSGVMLIKSCKESKEFFEKVLSLKGKVYDYNEWKWAKDTWHDQACLLKMLGCTIDPKNNYKVTYDQNNKYLQKVTELDSKWNCIMDYENCKDAIIRHYAGAYPIENKKLFMKYDIIGREWKLDNFKPLNPKQRWDQLIRNVPEIKEGKTCLYIGARKNRFQFEHQLKTLGYSITVLEAFQPNVEYLRSMGKEVIEADITKYETGRKWDLVMWWHGPEHINRLLLPGTVKKLEKMANKFIIMGCPYGYCKQDALHGNEYEIHRSALYIEDFLYLGYNAEAIGEKDVGGSNLLSWKVLK